MRTFRIIAALGVILSAVGLAWTAMQYLSLSRSEVIVQSLALDEDVIAPKLAVLLSGFDHGALILNELKVRHENNAALATAMATLTAESKQHALGTAGLWAGIIILFSVFLIKAGTQRKAMNPARNDS